MLNIIAEDQEVINHKDKQIISLQNSLKEKDEFLKTECADLSHTKVDIKDLLKKRVHEKDLEVSKVREDMKCITEELENEILQKEMLVLKVSLQQKDSDIKSLNELIERKE